MGSGERPGAEQTGPDQTGRDQQPVALLLLTRDPSGQLTGRKSVLATAARSLERAGLSLVVVVLSRHPVSDDWDGRPVHRVPLPPLPRVAASAALAVLGGRRTLNEALFDSPRVRRRTARLASRVGARVVVADGLRTSGPALACGLPVLVHLDDLLSDRYAAIGTRSDGSSEDVLGFFSSQLPARLRPAAGAVARRLIGVEARRADRRERQLAATASRVAMTSEAEAAELSRRTGRAVEALPMAVAVRAPGDPAAADPCSFVFLGLLDYAPNRAAVRWWIMDVAPALRALGGEDVRLTVVGQRDAGDDLDFPDLRYTGYVDDLGDELRRHRAMVVPTLSGAGVKTKVLDAWSVGLPVIATPSGAAGLTTGEGLVVAEDAVSFAAAVIRLRDDGPLASRTGRAGRAVLQERWSPEAVGNRWAAAVLPLLARSTTAP
jgi:hypothetical protein